MTANSPAACSARVIDDKLIRFGFVDATGNEVSIPLTLAQAESYAIMLARFVDRESRVRVIAVLEGM